MKYVKVNFLVPKSYRGTKSGTKQLQYSTKKVKRIQSMYIWYKKCKILTKLVSLIFENKFMKFEKGKIFGTKWYQTIFQNI